MLTLRLYMLQRITALLMAPLVLGHLAVMIYAIQGGLSAAEILSRTQGSFAWFAYYGLFVVAVSIHGAIGLRSIAFEWGRVSGKILDGFLDRSKAFVALIGSAIDPGQCLNLGAVAAELFLHCHADLSYRCTGAGGLDRSGQ